MLLLKPLANTELERKGFGGPSDYMTTFNKKHEDLSITKQLPTTILKHILNKLNTEPTSCWAHQSHLKEYMEIINNFLALNITDDITKIQIPEITAVTLKLRGCPTQSTGCEAASSSPTDDSSTSRPGTATPPVEFL